MGLFIVRLFFVGGGANNKNKKSDLLSVTLFAPLSQRQNMLHKLYFSVPF